MLMKKLSAIMLLACLPLFSQPVLAADKATPKQTTTAEVAKESGKLNINTATLAELTSLKGIGDKRHKPSSTIGKNRESSPRSISWQMSMALARPRWKPTVT